MTKHVSSLRVLALFLLFIPNAALAQEQIQAPVFEEGDFWQFKVADKAGNGISSSNSRGIIPDGIYVFRASNKRFQVSRIVGNAEIALEGPGLLSFLMGRRSRAPQASQTSTSQELNFPLFVGKKWEYAYELNIPHGTRHRTVDIRVVGRESVDTAAGNFDAFKIEKTIQWPTASGLWGSAIENVQSVYFYSSETKSIIKYNSEGSDGARRSVEILKFIPAK
jgi:hypothetical protein